MLMGIDLDLQLELGFPIDFGRKLEHQMHGVSRLMAVTVTQPCERITHCIDHDTNWLRLHLHQVNVFRVAQGLLEQQLVDGGTKGDLACQHR